MELTDKEIEERESAEKDRRCILFFSDYEKLEKDYNELKAHTEALEKENAALKKQIKEVENDSTNCEIWSYGKITTLEKENARLKEKIETHEIQYKLMLEAREKNEAQIERMKCCENCGHNGSDKAIGENGDYADYTCIQCDDLSTKENPYPNWELAE